MAQTPEIRPHSNLHIPELDGIRGLAVLLVVLLHCYYGIGGTLFASPVAAFIVRHLSAGVDLFFVLSGFLIGGILIDHRNNSNYFQVFWARRAARILPVYVILLLSYLAGRAVLDPANAPWSGSWLLLDPLPWWRYYLLFPALVFFLPRRIVIAIAVAGIVFACWHRHQVWISGRPFYAGYFPTLGRADAIMFGVLGAYAVRSPLFPAAIAGVGLLTDILGLLIARSLLGSGLPHTFVFTLYGLLSAYLIFRCFAGEGWLRRILRLKWLIGLGGISYALYMYHQAINGLLHGFILHQTPNAGTVEGGLVAALVIATSIVLATISTRYIEAPFRRLGRRVSYGDPPRERMILAT